MTSMKIIIAQFDIDRFFKDSRGKNRMHNYAPPSFTVINGKGDGLFEHNQNV